MFALCESVPLFSLPEPEAQVRYSDQNLSVVCHHHCWHHCCHSKLLTFHINVFTSSPEPLGQLTRLGKKKGTLLF